MQRPYQVVREVRLDPLFPNDGYRVELVLENSPDQSRVKERLVILTHVRPPYQDHPQALGLAALLRVRALLDEQIEAMQSP